MTQRNLKVSSAAISDKGLSDKRPQNEDSYLCLEDSGLFAVADGVGGAQAGDVASEMAVEILAEAFINLDEGGDAEDRMRQAIDQANASIYQMSRDLPSLSTMATTLVAIHISGNIATIGHVGDSRLYRMDSAGLLFRETQDHSVVEEEVRAGRMTREQAASHPSRNVISRALGAESMVEIDMKTIMFETDSSFLVCSDGVTRHIPDDELRELLFLENEPADVCRVIKERCYERGAEDNLTAVVVRAGSATQPPKRLEVAEEEAETVATARAGVSAGQVFPDIAENPARSGAVADDGFELDDLDDLDEFEDNEELEDTEEIVIPTREKVSAPASESANSKEQESVNGLDTFKDVKAYRVDENSGGGVIAKVAMAIGWILAGILLGAAAVYFFLAGALFTADDAAQTTNTAMISFEQQRRLVDADPAKYIATYSTKPDATAGDNYLIGRAYLIQGNYGAAKTSFEKATTQLELADVSNRAVLEHDISAGLTIANNEGAQKTFEAAGDETGKEEEGDAADEPQGD